MPKPPGAPGRQAGPASEDSCCKFQMLNAKCSVLNALHPRRRFTPCAGAVFTDTGRANAS